MAESSLASPILLDDYGVSNGDNITSLLTTLAGRSGANGTLHVKAPSTAMTLWCDYVNFGSLSITKFAFLESDADVTVRQSGTGALLWEFSNLREIVIGSQTQKASRDDYNLTLRGTWSPTNRGVAENGMITILNSAVSATGPWAFRCNYDRAKEFSFRLRQNLQQSYPNATVYFSGVSKSGAISIEYAKGTFVFENQLVTDPYCKYFGWTGDAAGTCSSSLDEPLGAGMQSIVSNATFLGRIDFAYGGFHFGGGYYEGTSKDFKLGESSDKPFEVDYLDFGWSGPDAYTDYGWPAGTKIGNWPTQCVWWKFNGIPYDDEGRWLKLSQRRGYGSPAVCASGSISIYQQVGRANYHYNYITFTLVNWEGQNEHTQASAYATTAAIHNLTYRGDGINPAMIWRPDGLPICRLSLSINDTAAYGQFHDIWITRTGAVDSSLFPRGKGNLIQNCSLKGKLTAYQADAGGTNNLAENIKFIGASREIIEAQAGSQIDITNLYAPAGSTIDVQSGATVRIWNGSGWTTLGTGTHTFSSSWTTDAGAIPADIPSESGVQSAAPAADITTTGWYAAPPGVALYSVLDESAPDDSDYVFTQETGRTYEGRFSPVALPIGGQLPVVSWRAKGSHTFYLRQGSSVEIASWTKSPTSMETFMESLTEEQADRITDGNDLRYRIVS